MKRAVIILMKKLLIIPSILAYSLFAVPVFADDVLNGSIVAPEGSKIISPTTSIGSIVSFIVTFIIVISFLAALLYIVIGAFSWITSGGDKAKVESARNHIVAAVIGLILIALSFVIINVIMTALGLGSLSDLHLPVLKQG